MHFPHEFKNLVISAFAKPLHWGGDRLPSTRAMKEMDPQIASISYDMVSQQPSEATEDDPTDTTGKTKAKGFTAGSSAIASTSNSTAPSTIISAPGPSRPSEFIYNPRPKRGFNVPTATFDPWNSKTKYSRAALHPLKDSIFYICLPLASSSTLPDVPSNFARDFLCLTLRDFSTLGLCAVFRLIDFARVLNMPTLRGISSSDIARLRDLPNPRKSDRLFNYGRDFILKGLHI
ncbi:hypothetical protein B0H10DRAFT_1943635 [Mycena sp. CBHHK59/15]|nr:hypothetical protein B0H10DRAFT_1943635 [Mycena sp. CBHHK59/15]